MFKKILVGVDGLEGGRDAIALATTLASPGTEFVVLHAYPLEPFMSRAGQPDYDALVRGDAEELLGKDVPAEWNAKRIIVGDSSPARGLHHKAEEEGADLIVIGSCRRGALDRVLAGNVAKTVLHGSPVPVAVAPRDYGNEPGPIGTIGVGYNATKEARAALDAAIALAQEHGAKLRILTAVHTPASVHAGYPYTYDMTPVLEQQRIEAESEIEQAAAQAGVEAAPEIVDGAAADALDTLSQHVDLIVAGSRGWGPARRVFLGSTTDHLAQHVACPLLVVTAPAES